ncbi:hypothetical protein BpHYR1_024533 [Brachionus plicatilis]|uniref:Phorbol-ester/DAG-type domain-containing protein n=1 Tax=Brachionus plicatilis TaxID=10195 RepID=A0A3M7PSP1_BRAPC|nr:hypothetical protein BpHYR1_024533 [Brachionus plicatilis]
MIKIFRKIFNKLFRKICIDYDHLRRAPTKAQRRRKLKENESKQRKKAKLDDVVVDQAHNEESNTCKLCQNLLEENPLNCSTCNFSFHRSCVKIVICLSELSMSRLNTTSLFSGKFYIIQ